MFRPQVITFFSRKFSFNIFKFWNTSCEKVECTKPIEPVQKYVIQKSCCRSIFETWKPKVPDLNARNYPSIKENMMMPYKYKHCKSGMKFREKSRCEIEARARECERINHPKWLKFCPPIPKRHVERPLPVLQDAVVKCKASKGKIQKAEIAKSMRKRCEPHVPEGDWNTKGHIS